MLRRLDCVLEATKPKVLAEFAAKKKEKLNPDPFLLRASRQSFYNTSDMVEAQLATVFDVDGKEIARQVVSEGAKPPKAPEGSRVRLAPLSRQAVTGAVSASTKSAKVAVDFDGFRDVFRDWLTDNWSMLCDGGDGDLMVLANRIAPLVRTLPGH